MQGGNKMKLKSKWVYSYAKGLKEPMVSVDYHLEGDDLYFALVLGIMKLQSVVVKLNINDQTGTTIFDENHTVRSVANCEAGRIYFTSMKGVAYCLGLDGKMVWETVLNKNNASFKTARDDDYFYASDYSMYCLRKEDGSIVWENNEFKQKMNCSIVVDDKYLYCAELGGYIFCLDKATGETVWKSGNKEWVTNIEKISGDRLLVNHSHGKFFILNSNTGDMISTIAANGYLHIAPVFDGNKIYIGDENDVSKATAGNMTCYEVIDNNLHEIFKYEVGGGVSSKALIDDNRLFFASGDCYLHCIDKVTGEELMSKKKTKGTARSIIRKDNNLIVLSDKGQVECFEIIE